MERREFFRWLGTGVIAAVGIGVLANCSADHQVYGGGGGGGGAAQGGSCVDNGVNATVQLVHPTNHDITIPKTDVIAGVDVTYLLGDNGSGHVHQVTLTAAHFAQLQNGLGVVVTSTGPGHTHAVTVNCA